MRSAHAATLVVSQMGVVSHHLLPSSFEDVSGLARGDCDVPSQFKALCSSISAQTEPADSLELDLLWPFAFRSLLFLSERRQTGDRTGSLCSMRFS